MPVVVGVLLVLAGVAVVRNVLFFMGDASPRAVAQVAPVDLAPPAAAEEVEQRASPVGPPEARMTAWLARPSSHRRLAAADPFHLAQRHGAVVATRRGPRLQGVLTAQGRTTALVDGTAVAVGEPIGDGRVAAIAPTGVRLTTPHGDQWLEFQPWETDAVADGGD